MLKLKRKEIMQVDQVTLAAPILTQDLPQAVLLISLSLVTYLQSESQATALFLTSYFLQILIVEAPQIMVLMHDIHWGLEFLFQAR